VNESLARRHCQTSSMGDQALTDRDINRLLTHVTRWHRIQEEGTDKLRRSFHFPDFKQAFNYAFAIAALAEREDHHPVICVEWGKVTVTWWTHKVRGLHENDFIMAAKCDLVASRHQQQP
jgi:4a-hydroxytetrahydrobiopterin dehydratase